MISETTLTKEIEGFLRGARLADYIAVDTEANGGDVRDGRGYLTGTSIAYTLPGIGLFSYYFPLRHKNGTNFGHDVLVELKDVIENHENVVFHNAKFDLVNLATTDINRTKLTWCSMIMAHMVNENWQSKALDWLGGALLNDHKIDEVAKYAKAFGWNEVPVVLMTPYAKKDAELCLRLFAYLYKQMEKQELLHLWPIESDFAYVLIKMEGRGVLIDQQLCKVMSQAGRTRMDEIADDLGLNPGSPKQLKELLIDVLGLPVVKWTQLDAEGNPTEKSRASFDKFAMIEYEELLEARADTTANLILEYRGWSKSCSSNYEAYLELLSPDGRLRPNYKIHGTVTGRLSCEKPNLQQIPKVSDKPWNGHMKDCFIPKPGYRLIEADYSQLELRLGAAYADEKDLLAVFAEGRDIFTEMAEQMGISRFDTKTMVYSIQYGAGIRRLKNVFKTTTAVATARRDLYYQSYPGFRAKTQAASSKAKSQGYLKLWTGRRRHFQNPEKESHKAFNSVIQGGSAEIVKRTMIRVFNEIDNEVECRMLLQVHDSILFEVLEDKVDHYSAKIKECMERVEPDFGVHFAVEVKTWST